MTNLILGKDMATDELLRLLHVSLRSGTYIIGKQGTGKSNFILTLFAQLVADGFGAYLADPHGDLITDALALIPAHREQDVILLDMHDTAHPFGLDLLGGVDPTNPSSLAAGEERVVEIFKKTWGDTSWGPRLEDLLATSVHTLLCNPGMTIAELPRLLTDPDFRHALVANVQSQIVRDYWANEYDVLKPGGQAAIFSPVMNKLRAFLRNPILARLVSQPGATLDFNEVLAHSQIVLVRMNRQLPAASTLVGTTLIYRIFETALGRQHIPARQRPPFALIADEFQRFATTTFGELLEEARKYSVSTVLGHQRRAQLTSEIQSSVKGAVNLVCFQIGADDARELSHEFSRHDPPTLPDGDLLVWALQHRDPALRCAAFDLMLSLQFITVQAGEAGPAFSKREKHHVFEERLRYAVRTGNAKIGAFAAGYRYGSLDLVRGDYGTVAEAFARLRDRLLSAVWIEPGLLVSLPQGQAAVKIKTAEGMRQALIRIPLAITSECSATVHAVLEQDTDQPTDLPFTLNPRYVEAGKRARRIRQRSRDRWQAEVCPAAEPAHPRPSAPPEPDDDCPFFFPEADLED